MNYVYDILCNFSEVGEFIDSFEWDKKDSVLLVEKIPIYQVSSKEMFDLIHNTIKLSKTILLEIENHTHTDFGVVPYACLVTDSFRVIALQFSSDGVLIKRSSLLYDEESAIMEEINQFILIAFSFEIIKKEYELSFLTRKEKNMQKYLLIELEKVYELGLYDELDYLYHEVFDDYQTNENMFLILFSHVKENFSRCYYGLYNIVRMIPIQNHSSIIPS